jgi:FKBP-type peptidyl-prolyl cis-trans isomerase FkpA
MRHHALRRLAAALPALPLLCCLALGARAVAAPVEPAEYMKHSNAKGVDPKKALAQEKARGKAYIAKAAKLKGAVKTKSGMVYMTLKKGTGPSPTASSVVKLDQTAATIDGKIFDESKVGVPSEIDLTKVIPCWREGVPMMKVGEKARFICPPELAFGDRSAPDHFPGGATIVYEIELFGIVNPGPAPAATPATPAKAPEAPKPAPAKK